MRRFLKQKLNGEISDAGVEHVQKFIQTTLDDYCDLTDKLHQEQNKTRKTLGLKENRRFSEEVFIKASKGFKRVDAIDNCGIGGRAVSLDTVNRDTPTSGS